MHVYSISVVFCGLQKVFQGTEKVVVKFVQVKLVYFNLHWVGSYLGEGGGGDKDPSGNVLS